MRGCARANSLQPMTPTRILSLRLWSIIPLALAPTLYSQGISLTNSGFYTQNFDSLPTTPGISWLNYGTLPGWIAQTDATPNPLPIAIFNGGDGATSGFLSMGFAGNTDRAIGFRPTTTSYGMTLWASWPKIPQAAR